MGRKYHQLKVEEKCEDTFPDLSHLKRHQESQCSQDNQSYIGNSSFKIENEMIFPGEIKQELHACEECAKTFTSLFVLDITFDLNNTARSAV